MSILFSNEIVNSVKKELQSAITSVQIITAYCKENAFMRLNAFISDVVKEKRLLVRFRMEDILKGSTDFSVVESGLKSGWKVYIRFDLHAKTYIVDNKSGLIGSANVTNLGLSVGKKGNMEMATLVDVEAQDIDKINRLFDDAICVDELLLSELKIQIERAKNTGIQANYTWDESIICQFNPHIDTLFSYELPEDFSMAEGEYFSFMDETFTGDINKFKNTFRWSNAYLWLMTILKENKGCLYFGALTEKLHNALVSDPKPYRRDVKNMLANLLALIVWLDMEEIMIDVPNYSQRVRLIDLR